MLSLRYLAAAFVVAASILGVSGTASAYTAGQRYHCHIIVEQSYASRIREIQSSQLSPLGKAIKASVAIDHRRRGHAYCNA